MLVCAHGMREAVQILRPTYTHETLILKHFYLLQGHLILYNSDDVTPRNKEHAEYLLIPLDSLPKVLSTTTTPNGGILTYRFCVSPMGTSVRACGLGATSSM